ncbi:glycosyltransferase [Cohnella sp. WQ 127256]|uniref:MGDG synthase family glycosyltransferase n=1 Tax=Cohnella sp. WQ 127256 TaxID=2938790 RepID=UPI0021190165|nr:glycosyltransferase [Cohnella sp. WQ 127256]
MSKQRKIFILYARFGEGHWKAATALEHSFAQLDNTDIQLIDLLAESHPLLNEFSRYVYNKSYTVLPQIYGWVYEATKGMKSNSLFASWLHSFGALTLQRLVEQERPDAIIHTFPNLVLPLVAQRTGHKIPMFNVVTDFDLHFRWIHPDVDKYYVATEDIRMQLIRLGIHSGRVAVTGIPIRPTFLNRSTEVTETFTSNSRYNFNPHKPVVLIMAASNMTWADTTALCQKLLVQCKAQVILVCGRNRSLKSSLSDYFQLNDDVTVLGYVDDMDELMALSACIITKAGGLILSEAIAAELPLLLYRPVPGQERNNALYLESKGAAILCQSVEQLIKGVAGLLFQPKIRVEMQLALQALGKKGASDRIALDIVRQLHIMEEASSTSASALVPV